MYRNISFGGVSEKRVKVIVGTPEKQQKIEKTG
jgi:hypothetical protein